MRPINILLMGSEPVINLDDHAVTRVSAAAVYSIRSTDAKVSITSGGPQETWCSILAKVGNYEVFATVNSGSLATGTAGSWLALSSTRTWTASLCDLTMQIRKIGTSTVLDTAHITLTET